MALFHDNAFGVDVYVCIQNTPILSPHDLLLQDDYHIIVFQEVGPVNLSSKLRRYRASPGLDDEFYEHTSAVLMGSFSGMRRCG